MENINEIIIGVISACVTFVSSFFSYKQGKKQRVADANKTAYESYDYALRSLKTDFESRFDRMQKDIDRLYRYRCFDESCKNRKI